MDCISVKTLKPHPQNTFFFDDMTGTKWEEFIKSVETSGIIEPIVITDDYTIVSGHQRTRACIELGIEEIPVCIKKYPNDDAVLKDLLETNIRQRGNIDSSALKLGRIIVELERLYGVQTGRGGDRGNQYVFNDHYNMNNIDLIDDAKSQEDLIKIFGINRSSYFFAKKLTDLIPDIQNEIEGGNISASTASRILSKLTPEDQTKVYESLPKDVKLSQKEVQQYVDEIIKEKDDDIDAMVERVTEANRELKKVNDEVKRLQKESEAYKKRLEDKDRDIAGEFILQRDKAFEDARRANEKYLLKQSQEQEARARLKDAEEKLRQYSLRSSEVPDNTTEEIQNLRNKVAALEKEKQKLEDERDGLPSDVEDVLRFFDNACGIIQCYASSDTTNTINSMPDIKQKLESRARCLIEQIGMMLGSKALA